MPSVKMPAPPLLLSEPANEDMPAAQYLCMARWEQKQSAISSRWKGGFPTRRTRRGRCCLYPSEELLTDSAAEEVVTKRNGSDTGKIG